MVLVEFLFKGTVYKTNPPWIGAWIGGLQCIQPSCRSLISYIANWGRYFESQETKSLAGIGAVLCCTSCSIGCCCSGSGVARSSWGKGSLQSKCVAEWVLGVGSSATHGLAT